MLLTACGGLLAAIFPGLFLTLFESPWTPDRVAESQRRGETIVLALRQYNIDHSVYPAALNDLVPKYLTAIPAPTVGTRKWKYTLRPYYFSLAFGSRASSSSDALYPSCSHLENGGWYTDN